LSSEADVRERTATASIPKKSKRDWLDNLKAYDIIVRQQLRTEQELFVLANEQKEDGKTDLLEFILRLSKRRRAELMETAWHVHEAKAVSARMNMFRSHILMETATSAECVCDGQYATCAQEILLANNIDVDQFKDAIFKPIRDGRKEGNNIMITGSANCGKTFLLRPLTQIFKCCVSPATGTLAWVGAESAEVVFLK